MALDARRLQLLYPVWSWFHCSVEVMIEMRKKERRLAEGISCMMMI